MIKAFKEWFMQMNYVQQIVATTITIFAVFMIISAVFLFHPAVSLFLLFMVALLGAAYMMGKAFVDDLRNGFYDE